MKLRLIALGSLVLSLAACAGPPMEPYAWTWKHPKASVDELRTVARDLTDPQLSDEAVLDRWAAFSASFGLFVFRPSYARWVLPTSAGLETFWIPGSRYTIDENDVTGEGWRMRCRAVDLQSVKNGESISAIDAEGVFLSASEPGVWFLGQHGASQQLPAPDKLKETALAISQGNGRLIFVDLSGKYGVEVLPYGLP